MESGTAVKAFLLNENNELLLIRRADDDPHKPGAWEIPGGRLDKGKDMLEGLKRETREETWLDIKIHSPLKEHSFTRDDSQKTRMFTYLCRLADEDYPMNLTSRILETGFQLIFLIN